jgi:hypothetical protein
MLKRSDWMQVDDSRKTFVSHPLTSKGEPVSLVVLHHSAGWAQPFVEKLRAIERQHTDGEFYDFAYNFAVSNLGDTAEGRGATTQGGATGNGMDSKSLSVCAVGDYHTDKAHATFVTRAFVEGVAGLLARLVDDGYVTPSFRLAGHGEFKATLCPGGRLTEAIPEIMALTRKRIERGQVQPASGMSDTQKLEAIAAILEA